MSSCKLKKSSLSQTDEYKEEEFEFCPLRIGLAAVGAIFLIVFASHNIYYSAPVNTHESFVRSWVFYIASCWVLFSFKRFLFRLNRFYLLLNVSFFVYKANNISLGKHLSFFFQKHFIPNLQHFVHLLKTSLWSKRNI